MNLDTFQQNVYIGTKLISPTGNVYRITQLYKMPKGDIIAKAYLPRLEISIPITVEDLVVLEIKHR